MVMVSCPGRTEGELRTALLARRVERVVVTEERTFARRGRVDSVRVSVTPGRFFVADPSESDCPHSWEDLLDAGIAPRAACAPLLVARSVLDEWQAAIDASAHHGPPARPAGPPCAVGERAVIFHPMGRFEGTCVRAGTRYSEFEVAAAGAARILRAPHSMVARLVVGEQPAERGRRRRRRR